MFPWEAKEAQLRAMEATKAEQPTSCMTLPNPEDMTAQVCKTTVQRAVFVWRLLIICGGLSIASAITLCFSQIVPYNQPVSFMLPAIICAILMPIIGRFTWLLLLTQGLVKQQSLLCTYLSLPIMLLQMGHMLMLAMGVPIRTGTSGGIVGTMRALGQKKYMAGLISGVTGVTLLFTCVCGIVVWCKVIGHLKTGN